MIAKVAKGTLCGLIIAYYLRPKKGKGKQVPVPGFGFVAKLARNVAGIRAGRAAVNQPNAELPLGGD